MQLCASSTCNWPLAQDVFKAGMGEETVGSSSCGLMQEVPVRMDLLLTRSNPVCKGICVRPRGKFTFFFFFLPFLFFIINATSGIYCVRKHCNLVCAVGTGCSCAHQQAGALGWSRHLSLHDLLVSVEINATVSVSLAVLFQLLVSFAVSVFSASCFFSQMLSCMKGCVCRILFQQSPNNF